MNPDEIGRYYRTLKHLKLKQLFYGVYYRIRSKIHPVKLKLPAQTPQILKLSFTPFPEVTDSYEGRNTFTFLNRKVRFKDKIEWNFPDHGKLWTYHLTYFDYLLQQGLDRETGLKLIREFNTALPDIKDGLEPYPVSLRSVNWIKFLSLHGISDSEISRSLLAQYQVLFKQIEYHLLGNHLFENGISLLFGAVAFNNRRFYKKAESILKKELKEQILSDGGHFERSPMYHLILLNRLLDAYNLLINNSNQWGFDSFELEGQIKTTAEKMLSWLVEHRFSNGDLPAVNDSTRQLPISPDEVFSYATRLGLNSQKRESGVLGESGYKMVRNERFELFMDAGKPGPEYIPGHAHCDIFSFLLHVNQKPVVVDTGVSTYEENERRLHERSTSAHNTVVVKNGEQSEIWKSFRMGRRAKVNVLQDDKRNLIGTHNGFKEYGAEHERRFSWSENKIEILDLLHGESGLPAKAFIHLHPDRVSEQTNDGVLVDKQILFEFEESDYVEVTPCEIAFDFNLTRSSFCIEIGFRNCLKSTITISEPERLKLPM